MSRRRVPAGTASPLESVRGVFLYLIPGTLLLLAVAISLRGLFTRFERPTRRRFFLGAATWAVGAIGLEVIEAAVSTNVQHFGGISANLLLASALMNTTQDAFELIGTIIMLSALLRHASDRSYELTLTFPRAEPKKFG